MAVVNHDSRQVQFKIVYCGTPLGGKTTNLKYIHENLPGPARGDMVSIATAHDRTLFFDFLPVHATEIAGYLTRFQIYTVPGQKAFSETRQIVLRSVDGIVFVADSSPERARFNAEALDATRNDLLAMGRNLDSLPVIFQFNKRDLPDALPPEEIDQQLGIKKPTFLACARTGYNVFSTLDAATQEVLKEFHFKRARRSHGAGAGAPSKEQVAV